MRCPVCRCLLNSAHVCYECGYDGRISSIKPLMEVKTMSWDDDEYQDRLDALNDVIDAHLGESSEDDSDEGDDEDEE